MINKARTPRKVASGIFMVGGPDLTDPRDCLCYLVDGPQARVLIDCGAGPSAAAILDLAVKAAGKPPTHLLLT
ncbi:MAG: MBL fold metallo-hydrolase, partial [Proteobacteria bacterium]|nr:MBL fold metallo-hydrolase [Pseudomonadota bacterium]